MALQEPLDQIVFEITHRCPLKCVFCYNVWLAEENKYQVGTELTADEIQNIFKKVPKSRVVTLSGGEPLLRKDDLPRIVKAARTVSQQVHLLTSGIPATDKTARLLSNLDVSVQISVHGTRKTHNTIVGLSNGFDRMVEGARNLKRNNVPLTTSTVVCKKNIHELKEILEICIALGVTRLLLIRFLPGGRGLHREDLLLSTKEVKKMYDISEEMCRYYGVQAALGVPNIPCRIPEKKYRKIAFGNCGAGINWFAIDPFGRVRICNHSPTILGDLKTQSFEAIWNHPILENFRNLKYVPAQCRSDCKHRKTCRGGCRAVAETMFNDFSAPDPLMISS